MITRNLPDFKLLWEAILNLEMVNRSPYMFRHTIEEMEQIDRELINIIKAVERGDSLLPDNCE